MKASNMTRALAKSATSVDQTLLQLARDISRAEHRKRGLLRELREVNDVLRVRKRELKHLAGALADRGIDTPPLRQFGETCFDAGAPTPAQTETARPQTTAGALQHRVNALRGRL